MKVMIVYSTYGGVTKECAEMLEGHLNERFETELINAREREIPEPDGYDIVILGSSIRMGSMNKKIKKYIKSNREKLAEKPCGIFFCCGYTKQFQEYVETQLPRRFSPSLGCHLFGGEMKPEKLRGMDKLIIAMMRSAIKSQDFEENDSDHHDLPEIFPENIVLLAKEIRKVANNC